MPTANDLLDAIRTGDVTVRDYILILHPEQYDSLRLALHSAAIRDGMDADPRFFGFEIRVDRSVPRDQVVFVRRAPPPPPVLSPFRGDLRPGPLGYFLNGPLRGQVACISNGPEISWSSLSVDPDAHPQPPKTLWDHLEADWGDEKDE